MLVAATLTMVLAPAAGADALQILSPQDQRFFSAPPVHVKVRTASSVRSLEATLQGKGVSGTFSQVRPGVWRARLGAGLLRAGSNHLVISARGRGGERDYAATRIVVGKRKRGLLTLDGPRVARSLVAEVRVAADPQRLSAKLNGKQLRWPLDLVPTRSERLRLGADDGLHFGANRLQVLAIRRGGVFDVERRTVVVPRVRPLAGAGRDRRTASGSRLRLDGRSSRPALGKRDRLSYSWQVVGKPRGAKAKLRRAGSVRPSLQADKAGRYRVRLTVTEPRRVGGRQVLRASSDVVTVTSVEALPPIGETIETIVYNGKSGKEADTGIRIGAKTYWLGMPKGNAYQAVILERTTLAPLYVESFSDYGGAGVEAIAAKMKQYGAKALVVLSVPNLEGDSLPNLGLPPLVKELGANVQPIATGRPGWSVVGVPGSAEGAYLGTGWSQNLQGAGDVRGNLSGYLQQTSTGEFAFVPGSREAFDTAVSGTGYRSNTIKVGAAEYKATLPECADGGFQLQVLLAETLAPVGEATFITHSGGICGTYDEDEQKRMAATLNAIAEEGSPTSEGPKLIFVQSIGSPYDPAAKAWNQVATALARVGGTASVFAAARSGYSLVGGLGISRLPLAEASETLTGKTARISGVLKQDRLGAFSPQLSSPTGGNSYQLSTIAYQPSQPWPASQSPGEKAALRYIAETVLHLEKPSLKSSCYVPAQPDVRSEYCNLEYENKWSTYALKLNGTPFKAGNGFGEPEWKAVVAELEVEFESVQSVWTFVRRTQGFFGVAGSGGAVDLETVAHRIEKAIKPPPRSEAAGWWMELFGNLSSVGSYFSFGIEGEIIQKVLGIFQGTMFESAASIYGKEGDPLLEEFEVKSEDLAAEFAHRYTDASAGVGFVGELLVSDAGKLRAVQASGMLGFKEKGFKESIVGVEKGTELWTYQSLLPVAYEAISLEQGGLNEPLPAVTGEYECAAHDGRTSFYRPFKKVTPAAEYRLLEPSPSLGLLVLAGSRLPSESVDPVYPKTPAKALLEPLVEPATGKGLAYFAPWFWRNAYDYPSAKTKTLAC